MIIYLSPSTQEKNIGVGGYGTEEKRMNELADLMQVHLKRNGLIYKRNNPSFTPSQSSKDSNSKIGKDGLHVALHSNSGGGIGTEIYYFHTSKVSKALAESVYKELAPLTPGNDRGVKPNTNFTELMATLSPSILIEVDFHDNKQSVEFMLGNMNKIAETIVKGICNHIKKPYIAEKKVITVPVNNATLIKKGFYRVIVGSFQDKQNAVKQQTELKSKGFDSFIEYKE